MILKYLKSLYELQKIEEQDKEIVDFLENDTNKQYLKLLKEKIERLQTEYQKMSEQSLVKDRQLSILENKSQDYYNEIKVLDERIYSGKVMNMKELVTLQDKVNTLKSNADKVDNAAIELLVELENLKKNFESVKCKIEKLKTEYQSMQLKLDKKINEIKKEQDLIKLEKDKLAEIIPEDYLEKYYKIKSHKKNPVASIKDHRCNGCKMTVSNLVIEKVHEYKNIVYCENCGRILF